MKNAESTKVFPENIAPSRLAARPDKQKLATNTMLNQSGGTKGGGGSSNSEG